jgi:hypothetical protein
MRGEIDIAYTTNDGIGFNRDGLGVAAKLMKMTLKSRRIRTVSLMFNTGECTATRDASAKALEPLTVAAKTLWHVGSRKMRIAIALKSIFIVIPSDYLPYHALEQSFIRKTWR